MASTSLWRSLSAPMPSASSARPFKSLKAAISRRPRPWDLGFDIPSPYPTLSLLGEVHGQFVDPSEFHFEMSQELGHSPRRSAALSQRNRSCACQLRQKMEGGFQDVFTHRIGLDQNRGRKELGGGDGDEPLNRLEGSEDRQAVHSVIAV